MRFHLDEDQSPITARTARQRYGLDVSSSHEDGLDGTTDEEQLLHAGRVERCIVTKNADDFIGLTDRFEHEQLPHAGVLIVPPSMPNDAYARIARAIAWYCTLYPEGVPPYFVSYLGDPPDDWQ
jgi:predicted nuclease of predicted toxin-antitoxin system